MATKSNPKVPGKSPRKFNKRENKLTSSNNSALELTGAEAYSISDTDGVDFIHITGASAVTLPAAKRNKGRCITFKQFDAAATTIVRNADLANINKAAATFSSMQAADEFVTLFCTGSEWLIVASRHA